MYVWFTNTNVYFSYCDSQKQSIKYAFSISNSVFFSKTRAVFSKWVRMFTTKRGKAMLSPSMLIHKMTAYSPFTSDAIANNANAALTSQKPLAETKGIATK